MKIVILGVGALLTAGALWADVPKEMAIRLPLMDKAPVVDGRIDPQEWAAASGSFGFIRYRNPNDTAVGVKSAFYLGRTRDRLFIAGLSEIGPYGLRKEAKGQRGGNKCAADDCYEIVLVPDAAAAVPDVRHLFVNFNGAFLAQAKVGGNMCAWNPKTVETKSGERDGWWHFEWSVSLDEIGFAVTPADRHAIRLCRNYKGIGDQWGIQTSIRVADGAFFSSARTIPLVFDDAAVAVQLNLDPTGDTSLWKAKLRLTNPTACATEVEATVRGRPVNSQPGVLVKRVTLRPGETAEYPVAGAIIGDEKVMLLTEVKQGGRTVYCREFGWRPNGPAPAWLKPGDDGSAFKVDFAFYPSHDKMRLRADLASVQKRPKTVKVTLRNDANFGRDVLAETVLTLDKTGVADTIWDIPDLKAETLRTGVGGYTVTFVAEGVKDGRVVKAFRRDVFEWEGFKGGTSGTVPSMFTPIEDSRDGFLGLFGDRHVRTILKDHTIGDFELWKQVNAAGKDILARPMRLVAGNRTIEQSEQSNNSSLSASAEWDVDGMMTWTLTLRPGHCEPLTLEIPIRGERAKLLHPCADGLRFNYAGVVPPGEGRVWDSSQSTRVAILGDYLPYVWIGGPLRGIAVFGENDKGWVTSPESRCQEIWREKGGTVVLKLNLVQRPVDITEPRTIRIGFLATPTKPMEKDWRSKPIGGLIGSCYYWGGATGSDEISPYDGTDTFWRKMAEARRTGRIDPAYIDRAIGERVYHIPTNAPNFKAKYELFRKHFYNGMNRMAGACGKDVKYVWYTNGRGVRLGNEAGSTFADEWTVEEFLKRPFAFYDSKSYSLDPNGAYLDYAAYWWEKALALGVVDYYYWDDVFCQSNFDLVGTDAYRTGDGEVQPASGIFNQRAQVRRCAVLQAEHGWPDNKNWVHMTNTALAPVLSFAGTNYDWEDVAGGDTALQERYSRESIQAQSLGRQFGNQVAIMGYFSTRDKEKLKWLRRTGLGLALTHELQWRLVQEWCEMDAALTKWGYRDPATKVWNYWDEDVAFPVAVTGGVAASLAMRRQDGEALIIVSDFEKGGDYAIRPDCAALGVSTDFEAVDFETGHPMPIEDGCVKFHLSRFDFAIIRLKEKR